MSSIAIIGTGIAGMGCAHFLHREHEITVYEQNNYVGGHTNTVGVREPATGREVPIDTGFMVYNEVTYPLLTRLFTELDVPVKSTDMSFSVRHVESGLEYCGSSLNHLFAQRRNLLRPSFWRMLATIDRFNREAIGALGDPALERVTLGDYVKLRGYGRDFLDLYLTPMSSAVWSTPPHLMLRFPACTLLRFFHNHGFLGLHTQHQWLTVDGGSREYRDRLIAPWRDRIRIGDPVVSVRRDPGGVRLTTRGGHSRSFERLIIATHADQALRLLGDPRHDEERLLRVFNYQENIATLHTDERVMPRTRLAWASWNYEINHGRATGTSTATHYWMNSLQGVSPQQHYFVTIGRPDSIEPSQVIRRIDYEHPLFSVEAVQAQRELPILNEAAIGETETYFAGSYFGYGFHEDAFRSAVDLARMLLRRDPWGCGDRPAEPAVACAGPENPRL